LPFALLFLACVLSVSREDAEARPAGQEEKTRKEGRKEGKAKGKVQKAKGKTAGG
jgi:hypothetical protein